jgi:hypothetical protein
MLRSVFTRELQTLAVDDEATALCAAEPASHLRNGVASYGELAPLGEALTAVTAAGLAA